MPKLIVNYPQSARIGNDQLNQIKAPLRRLVAEAATTAHTPLTEGHVDFVPISYDDTSAEFSQPVAIEIEILGYMQRKEKMNKWAIAALKPAIADILASIGLRVELNKDLIRVNFQDPEGCHV